MPQPIAKTKRLSAASMRPPSIPEPMRDGQASLTRVLGLKVGRIVIDAGHGGHDTGTIGPTGLLEKDLCLDVALRLGALISQRLPGAEVIYTRDDDTFIPLEQRTAIATQAKADLFISIHANSSPDPSARGIETYYLNFSDSPTGLGRRRARERQRSMAASTTCKTCCTRSRKTKRSTNRGIWPKTFRAHSQSAWRA